MNKNIRIIDPTEYRGWDDLVLSTQRYSFFHSSGWARVLNGSYNYKPLYFTVIDNNALLALIPIMEVNSILTGKRAISLPFSDYCEPINERKEYFHEAFKFLEEYGNKVGWKYVELRGGHDLLREPAYAYYFSHELDLGENEENIFSNLRSSTRRNIKKAMKEGVTVEFYTSLDSIRTFYGLNCMTRKEHGLPPQPYSFFRKIHEEIIAKNQGFVALASCEGRNIAGAVYFQFGESAIYKYGASDKRYQHLRANNLVMWEAIRWYSKREYKTFFFGRTEPENGGLRQFKTGWGAREDVVNYYKYDMKKQAFVGSKSRLTGFHNKIFKRTPVPLLQAVGTLFYRHMG